jgi:hypothetical protein
MLDSDQERDLEVDESVELIIELKEIDSATIIIDGLDECNSQDRKREALFQGLKTIASSPGTTVKIVGMRWISRSPFRITQNFGFLLRTTKQIFRSTLTSSWRTKYNVD